jgi:hypothetical protein
MLGRTVFAATFFALAQFAMASPPGCLLGAVNQYEDPADIQAVCKAKDLSEKVAEICGDDAEAAMEAIADICNDVDVDVCKYILSANASLHGRGATIRDKENYVSCEQMLTACVIATAVSSASGSKTATGSSHKPTGTSGSTLVPEATGAAGKVEFGLAAVVAGLMVAAL